jgi:hypothetical protein
VPSSSCIKLKPADPFDLIRWLARSQSDPRKAVAELVENSLDANVRRDDRATTFQCRGSRIRFRSARQAGSPAVTTEAQDAVLVDEKVLAQAVEIGHIYGFRDTYPQLATHRGRRRQVDF